MEKFIPFEKLSKKKQREYNARKRKSWQGLNPVTRKPKPYKAYHRQKAQKWSDDSSFCAFCVLCFLHPLPSSGSFHFLQNMT